MKRRPRHDSTNPLLIIALLLCVGSPLVGPISVEAATLEEIDSLRIASEAESALAVISRTIPEAMVARDSTLLLSLEVRRGELLTSIGYARQGEDVLRDALALAQALGDSAKFCSSLRWLGVAVESQGRAEEAAALYERLLLLARRRGDRVHEAWARVGLAWNASRHGHGRAASDEYLAAAALFREAGQRRGEAWALNGLGVALAGLGQYDDARARYLEARKLAGETGYTMVQCLATNNLGTLEYSLGDPGSAGIYFRDAAVLYRTLGNLRESVIPGINLAICDAELGRLGQAADTLESMLSRCRREGHRDLSAKVLIQFARTRSLQGLTGEARAQYRSVISMGNDAPMKNRVEAITGLAELLDAADSSAAAMTLLADLAAALPADCDPNWRINTEISAGECLLHQDDSRGAAARFRNADRISRAVGVAIRRDRALIGVGRAMVALGLPDSAAHAFEEAARVWESLRGRPADPEWREARGGLGRALCTERIALDLIVRRGDARYAYERAQMFKARTLLERMAGPTFPQTAAAVALPLDHLQQELLDSGEILLDFFLGPTRSYLFAITSDSCRAIPLPAEDEIDPPVRLFHDLLSTPPSRRGEEVAIHGAAEAIDALLLGGAADLIRGKRRVYVSPDGVLCLVPFDLRSGDGRPEWIRIPSAAILGLIRGRRGDPAEVIEGQILALAGDPGPRAPLPGIRVEVRHLVRSYRDASARYLTDRDTLRLFELADAPAVLHVASHAETDDERPWLSKLYVGGEGLRADRLARARIPARLAVLSSCQTMYARVATGEGVLGLSTALLSAGAECVVATLWPVDDRTTAEFMESFYRALSSGRSAARAVQDAQAAIRSNPSTAHPFYWAGFVAFGRGEIEIPLRPRRFPGSSFLTTGVVALLILAALGLWRSGSTPFSVIGERGRRPMG